jgi:hypothetical protein
MKNTYRGNAESKMRITFVRNESSGILSPSYQIRILPLMRYLQRGIHTVNEVSLEEFLRKPLFSDVIVFQRYISEDSKHNKSFLSMAVQELRNNCRNLIWDIDDDLFDLASNHNDEVEIAMLWKFRSRADILMVSTQSLQEREFYNEKAILIPNHPIKEMKKTRYLSRNHTINVGYLGNFDRKSELLDFFAILAKEYPDQRICLYSYGVPLEFQVRLKTLSKFIELRNHSTMEYESILNHYSSLKLHFSIAPLKDTVFNQAKSAIKFIDYSVNNAPILMSNVGEISDILSKHSFLPPLGTDKGNVVWINHVNLILNQDKHFALAENLARLEFRKVRNLDNQKCDFEALMDLVLAKNLEI